MPIPRPRRPDVPYLRVLDDGLTVLTARPEHAFALEALQRVVFPTLEDAFRFRASHYLKHQELFPEGQFVVLDDDRVVAATATVRLAFDFAHVGHTFADIVQDGWLTSHQPEGDWLYGADLGVHPDYRRRGLAVALYAARQELVWRLGLRGQVTAGMMSGYGARKAEMSAERYYEQFLAGAIEDPTLSVQRHVGFEPRALLAGYLPDPVCDNYSVLLVLDADRDVKGASRRAARGYAQLRTELPGPRSRALVARRTSAVASGLGKATDLAIVRGEGGLLHDADGNTLIDLVGGIGMLAVGHSPPAVVEAIERQARALVHVSALVASYEPYVRLCELLNEVTPGRFAKKTVLANSGAEAVENAVKLARRYTGRPAVVCFEGGYHGRTLLTLSLTSKYGLFKKGFGPFAPEIVRLPLPQVYRTPPGMTEDEFVTFSVGQLDLAMTSQVDPSAVAAMIVEPVQGEAGFVPVPRPFLARIRELCDAHGIVMIADEVQCGFGRTGRLFACEHYDLTPDLIVTAKSLGAGTPISAVTGRAEIMDSAHLGGVGGTYGGSPIACAAAIEAVQMIRQPEFLAHACRLGAVMREVLSGWQATTPLVGDVRGLGPMMLVELVRNRETKEPAPEETLHIIRRAVQHGAVAMRAGLFSNGIRLLPPLVMPEAMLREGLDALGQALHEVAQQAEPVRVG